ncbi:MAG: copper chaperone PCu(A)C [Rhizobiales bacterium]|nr:copper chaperone PCu(A)C [Hyphomicrobiales bacterium]
MHRLAIFFAVLLAAALAQPACAVDFVAGNVKVSAPWTRVTPKGATVGAGYMSITNTGGAPDRLLGGAAEVASDFEIHEMRMDNGVMRMRQITNGLEIKPGQSVELKPGSSHLMFVGLKKPFVQGEHVKATLTFEKAGKVEVDFSVESIGAQRPGSTGGGPGMPGMGGMKHGH